MSETDYAQIDIGNDVPTPTPEISDEQLAAMNAQLAHDENEARHRRNMRNDKLQMMGAFIAGGIASRQGHALDAEGYSRCAKHALGVATELLALIEALP